MCESKETSGRVGLKTVTGLSLGGPLGFQVVKMRLHLSFLNRMCRFNSDSQGNLDYIIFPELFTLWWNMRDICIMDILYW